jgi:hypothetical protein
MKMQRLCEGFHDAILQAKPQPKQMYVPEHSKQKDFLSPGMHLLQMKKTFTYQR